MGVESKGGVMSLISCTLLILTCLVDSGLSAVEPCSQKGQPGQIEIYENVTVGTVVGKFDIVGDDTQVTLTNIPNSHFWTNVTSREIVVSRPLDFEDGQAVFKFLVFCRSNPTYRVKILQVILLKDLNDNPPVFTSEHYSLNISELIKPGTIIFKGISATDGDKNLYMQFDVVPGPYSSYIDFERSSKGEVTLKKILDYETIPSFTMQISVQDTPEDFTLPRRTATAKLTINVIDEDDMNPVFTEQHYQANIPSSSPQGTVIRTNSVISAADGDLTLSAPVTYSIWEYHDSFEINLTNAEIKLKKQLQDGIYTAVLTASQVDNPTRQGVSTLTLVVTASGVHARAPNFLQGHYNASVLESTPNDHVIVNVQAVDPDVGSVLSYRLSDTSGDTSGDMFGITDNADIILLKPLDFETSQKYELIASVTDNTYTSTVMVTITVEDVNDNNPIIANPNVNVTGEREKNAIVARIQASDLDAGTDLRYSLLGEHGGFTINHRGEIILSGEQAEYPATMYNLVALVEDNGSPPRQAVAHIAINFPVIHGPPSKLPPSKLTTTGEPPTAAAVMEKPDEVLPIVLGVIAAILLFVVIVLVILLIRSNRNKRRTESSPDSEDINNRRMYKDENLDKAKAPRHLDPEGLAYRSTAKGKITNTLDLSFDPDHGETSDGATSVQENPISSINHGYSASDVSDAGRDMDDIHIQTSVTPYADGYPGYSNGMYGDLKTFQHSPSNSSESLSSDSTPGSKKQLVKPDLVENKPVSNNKDYYGNNLNGTAKHHINGDLGGKTIPAEEKPEITVYF